jgi:hypothetical protein
VTATEGVDLLIGVAVLALVLYRQLQKRPVRDNPRLPLILLVIGVVELVKFLQHGHHGTGVIIALAGSLVLAAVFGAIRAATVHVWVDGGRAWRQGNWLTAALWIVSLGVHLGYDYLVDARTPLAWARRPCCCTSGLPSRSSAASSRRGPSGSRAPARRTLAPLPPRGNRRSEPPSKFAPAGDGRESAGSPNARGLGCSYGVADSPV